MALFGRKKNRTEEAAATPPSSTSPSSTPPSTTPPAPPGVPSEAHATGDFDVLVRALLAQMSGDEVTELGDDTVSASGHQTFLGNLRAQWNQREPGDREIWLRNAIHGFYLSALRDMSRLDTSMLRPGIRPQAADEVVRVMSAAHAGELPGPGGMFASRPMADGLVRVLIWDTPTTMAMVNASQLDEWGADFDALWEIAMANLANDPVEGRGWSVAEGCCWMAMPGDDYSAERLLIDGYLDTTDITSDAVLFHPNRNVAIVADPANSRSVQIAAHLALQHADEPNPVSLNPIVGRGNEWRPLELASDHPAAPLVDKLRLTERLRLHAQQVDLITRSYGDDGVFPAKLTAYNTPDGVLEIAAWTETVDTLLPRSTHISFVTMAQEVLTVPWDAAGAIVGHRMEATHLYPERLRVTTFPSEDELAQLRSHDISSDG